MKQTSCCVPGVKGINPERILDEIFEFFTSHSLKQRFNKIVGIPSGVLEAVTFDEAIVLGRDKMMLALAWQEEGNLYYLEVWFEDNLDHATAVLNALKGMLLERLGQVEEKRIRMRTSLEGIDLFHIDGL